METKESTAIERHYATQFNNYVINYRGNDWKHSLGEFFSNAGFDIPGISPVKVYDMREHLAKKTIKDILENSDELFKLLPQARRISKQYLEGYLEVAKRFFEENPQPPIIDPNSIEAIIAEHLD